MFQLSSQSQRFINNCDEHHQKVDNDAVFQLSSQFKHLIHNRSERPVKLFYNYHFDKV